MKLPISVVINTFQAERYLDLVLCSVVDHVEEIVVCDMYSEDRTVEIAEEFGAKVVYHERLGYADPARKYAVDQSHCDWVFILDADEVVAPGLWREIEKLQSEDSVDLVEFHWLNYMFGAEMDGAGVAARGDVHGRLFRRNAVTLHPEVHDYLRPKEGIRIARVPYSRTTCIHHFTYLTAEDFVGRVNRYTSIESGQVHQFERISTLRVVRKLVRDFWKRMGRQGGKALGWQGLSFSLLMMANDAMKFAKILEHQNGSTEESVSRKHRDIAVNLLDHR